MAAKHGRSRTEADVQSRANYRYTPTQIQCVFVPVGHFPFKQKLIKLVGATRSHRHFGRDIFRDATLRAALWPGCRLRRFLRPMLSAGLFLPALDNCFFLCAAPILTDPFGGFPFHFCFNSPRFGINIILLNSQTLFSLEISSRNPTARARRCWGRSSPR